ncbi:MAG: TonB-dependent receptor plug domain-containing protein [Chitinophagales bacterium]
MRWIATYLFFIFYLCSNGQKADSVLSLPAVVKEVSAGTFTRFTPLVSYKYLLARNLNDVLRENSSMYFKNYGNGQLSSISIRGTSAAQTDILWNGVKLNSPALGQADVSLFNTGMSDFLELSGVSRLGNVGGCIQLQNESKVDSGFSMNASFTYGSYQLFRTFAKVRYGTGAVSGVSRISYMRCHNDYRYINTFKEGHPLEKLDNARVSMLNFMQQLNARVNGYNTIHFNLWISDAQRQIPPIISKPGSKESQDDYSLRAALTWKTRYRKFALDFNTALLHDVIHYRNPEILLNEKSITEAFRNNVMLSCDSLNKFTLSIEAGYDLERAVVPAYQVVRTRHIGKLVAALKYEPNREWMLQLLLRESVYDKNLSPFSPGLAVRYLKYLTGEQSIIFRLNASRNFRFPTLNDWYWVPGGNRDLKTEKSCDGETGLQYRYGRYLDVKVNGFAKYITDWIQWVSTGTYWEPRNVKRVLTRGVEISARVEGPYHHTSPDFNFAFSLNYTFTRATNLDALSSADQSKGKQLIYVPLHVGVAGMHIAYKKFYVRASGTFTDAVFITTDNTQKLKAYALLDAEAGKDFTIRNCEIGVAFSVHNVTDVPYQNIAQRPMPGRNFEGTIRFKLN